INKITHLESSNHSDNPDLFTEYLEKWNRGEYHD
ncbi:MAG: galactose-6-phosphate isomerase subunit LacB, partial [Aerococcus urinaeequi]